MAAAAIEKAIIDFVHKVKDDPSLSDLFREAAHELADLIDPPKKSGKSGSAEPSKDE